MEALPLPGGARARASAALASALAHVEEGAAEGAAAAHGAAEDAGAGLDVDAAVLPSPGHHGHLLAVLADEGHLGRQPHQGRGAGRCHRLTRRHLPIRIAAGMGSRSRPWWQRLARWPLAGYLLAVQPVQLPYHIGQTGGEQRLPDGPGVRLQVLQVDAPPLGCLG